MSTDSATRTRSSVPTELLQVARRVVWFQTPEETLRDAVLFLNHAMTYGTIEELREVRSHFDDDELRAALRNAHPGIFNARSWSYWHLMLDMGAPPPLPKRRIPGAEGLEPVAWR